MTLTLTPGAATLAQLQDIWAHGHAVVLAPSSHAGITAAAARMVMVLKLLSLGRGASGVARSRWRQ